MNPSLIFSPRRVCLLLASILACILPTRSHAQSDSLDSSFVASVGPVGPANIYSVAVQPDGKVLLGGVFDQVNGVARKYVARLNADGSLDVSLAPRPYSRSATCVAAQPDGKALLCVGNGIVRHNVDGSLDTGFNPNFGGGLVYSMAVQPNGKIVLGGVFTQVNGVARSNIARLNTDGSLDTSFTFGVGDPGDDSNVKAVAIQPNGKILLGGSFGIFNEVQGVARSNIARLNSDGSLDTGFTGSVGPVSSVAIQADGKIILGGSNLTQIGVNVARLNADGSRDAGFFAYVLNEYGGSKFVNTVAIQADGKVIMAGSFTKVDDVARSNIARLNADGSLDAGFTASVSGEVFSIVVQRDGKIVLGGGFVQVNGVARSSIARLNGASSPALPPFFAGAADVGSGFSYLSTFGYFKLLPQTGYIYHNDLGFLYYADANDGKGGIYFYDFATTAGAKSLGFFYTSPKLFPYLYSFGLNTFVYYFPDAKRGTGFYTTAPRVFSRLDTGEVLFR